MSRKERIILGLHLKESPTENRENMFSNPVGKGAATASPAESTNGNKNDEKKPATRTGCCVAPASSDGNGM